MGQLIQLFQPLLHWPVQTAQFSSNGVALLLLNLPVNCPRAVLRGEARIALRQILAELLTCSVEQVSLLETVRGPVMPNAQLMFSLSYALNQCVIGVAREGAIGVDIVRIEAIPESERLARWYLLAQGCTQPANGFAGTNKSNSELCVEPAAAFAAAWAAMESASKCLGLGLTEMNPLRQQQLETCELLDCQQIDGYRIALALRPS